MEVQWGRTPLDPATFRFKEGEEGAPFSASEGSRLINITAGNDQTVEMSVWFEADGPPDGGSSIEESSGTVGDGSILRVIPQEHLGQGNVIVHPEITFRFHASGYAPYIDVISPGIELNEEGEVPQYSGVAQIEDVLDVRGPAEEIAALSFAPRSDYTAAPGSPPESHYFSWRLINRYLEYHDPLEGLEEDRPIALKIPLELLRIEEEPENEGDEPKVTYFNGWLELREYIDDLPTRVARLRLIVDDDQDLLFGTAGGAVFARTQPAPQPLKEAREVYDLSLYHRKGEKKQVDGDAFIDPVDRTQITIPPGTFARVRLGTGGEPPEHVYDRHVDILYRFDADVTTQWGEHRPVAATSAGSEADLHRQLLKWANNYPDSHFLVVGRCDDLGSDQYNETLADERRATAVRLLTTTIGGLAPIDSGRITSWGEQAGQPPGVTDSPLTPAERGPARLIRKEVPAATRQSWPGFHDTSHAAEKIREQYRRASIYAIGGEPSNPGDAIVETLSPGRAPTSRWVFLPGERNVPEPSINPAPRSDYRVMLRAGWDKPTSQGWGDLIPSKAEFEIGWRPGERPPPALNGEAVELDGNREVYIIYGAWTHDESADFTRAQLGIRSEGDPDGLIKITNPYLAAALGFGPVLLSGVTQGEDTVEQGARISALAAGASFATVEIDGRPLIGPESAAILKSIEAAAEVGSLDEPGDDWRVALTSDYTTTLHVNAGVLGLRTEPGSPVVFRFSKVGVRFDKAGEDLWEQIALEYPTDALEVEDPGTWQMSGALGKLLRAVDATVGTGSIWFEIRFAFALSIGVVEVSEAVARVTFDDSGDPPHFSLRGLQAAIDVPAMIRGEGKLNINHAGEVSAAIDLDIVPLEITASAALALSHKSDPAPYTYVNLFAKVQFPTPIPLGPSGAGLYGLVGQAVINGARNVGTTADIVSREIGWWGKSPASKYAAQQGQHALGLGAVIGTLPDGGFAMSAQGMIVVAFPSPEVIFGVEVELLNIPQKSASDTGGAGDAAITGLVVIDDQAVSLAVSADYKIPRLLSVTAPFSAYFPYSGRGTYVRIGSDGHAGRPGEPVTLTILPDVLGMKAFGYLMIEQDGLHELGGNPKFSFDGFSVGFGAGYELDWSAGPIALHASALVLAGFGTDPLLVKAGIVVRGQLDLVVLSVGASGDITLTYLDQGGGTVWLDGEFCGRVKLWFFSIKGCVKFKIGAAPTAPVPPPPPPVAAVFLTDRNYEVMGEAAVKQGSTIPELRAAPLFTAEGTTGVTPSENNTVWPDTAPVINFRHPVSMGGLEQFDIEGDSPGSLWFGSNRLKYAYRIRAIRLLDSSGALVASSTGDGEKLQATWTSSPVRRSDGTTDTSGAEVQALKLLDWMPAGWALPMTDGGASHVGDPAGEISQLCEELPEPTRSCVFGRDATAAGEYRIRLSPVSSPAGPYPNRFSLTGTIARRSGESLTQGEALISQYLTAGAHVDPGEVEALPRPIEVPEGTVDHGYRLPAAERLSTTALSTTALPWAGKVNETVRQASLYMLVRSEVTPRAGAPTSLACVDFSKADTSRAGVVSVPGYDITARGDHRHLRVGAGDRHILIPTTGAVIQPTTGPSYLELHFRGDHGANTAVEWTDANGRVYGLVESGIGDGGTVVRLEAHAPIAQVIVIPEARGVRLHQICAEPRTCLTFDSSYEGEPSRTTVIEEGMTFRALGEQSPLHFESGDEMRRRYPFLSEGTIALTFRLNMEILPNVPWKHATINVHTDKYPIFISAYDADGRVVDSARQNVDEPRPVHLSSEKGITRITLSIENGNGIIWRVCYTPLHSERCFDFAAPRLPERKGSRVLAPRVASPRRPVTSPSQVERVRVGSRKAQQPLIVPGTGVRLDLEGPSSRVRIRVRVSTEDQVVATAFNAHGVRVASHSTPRTIRLRKRPQRKHEVELTLTGEAITQVHVKSAAGTAQMLRICTVPEDQPAERRPAPAPPVPPSVRTYHQGVSHRWTNETLSTFTDPEGRAAAVVAYHQPTALTEVDSFEVHAETGNVVTLLSMCAVTTRAVNTRARDAYTREKLKRDATEAAQAPSPAATRELPLTPGETYTVQVDWTWQHWESNDDATDSPPALPPAQGWRGPDDGWSERDGRLEYCFKVANEQVEHARVPDGLNEYRFDPRDLARYIDRSEPADGRGTVFTDDPLWVHFTSGHVEQLLDAYGRGFELEVIRTDPPPRAAAEPPAPAIRASARHLLRAWAPPSTQTVAEVRINSAAADAPCLPDGPILGGASLGARFTLEPNAMYDFNLLAGSPAGGAGEPIAVHSTRFVTSRYANPAEMLTALGLSTHAAYPVPAMEIVLPHVPTLPTGELVVSDRALGDALEEIGADTLPLPQGDGRTLVLWALDGAEWKVAGVLLDAPEPLRRETSLLKGDVLTDAVRCEPTRITIGNATLTPVRATTNWTRVLFVPGRPISIPGESPPAEMELELRLDDGASVIRGRRFIPSRPVVIETEGF